MAGAVLWVVGGPLHNDLHILCILSPSPSPLPLSLPCRHPIKELVMLAYNNHLLDGDGHSIYDKEHYIQILQDYETEILELERHHNTQPIGAQGISALDFHQWIAKKLQDAFPNFQYAHKFGRGAQAQEICSSALAFIAASEE